MSESELQYQIQRFGLFETLAEVHPDDVKVEEDGGMVKASYEKVYDWWEDRPKSDIWFLT